MLDLADFALQEHTEDNYFNGHYFSANGIMAHIPCLLKANQIPGITLGIALYNDPILYNSVLLDNHFALIKNKIYKV